MSGSKGKRSNTTCVRIRNIGNKHWHINFTIDGSPYGDQVNQFMNYICMIVRDRVPYNLHEWRDIKNFDYKFGDKMWAKIKIII
jgi:hypothetical protein